jgi:glycosyltransferase involved in cell wall biosynthesis
MSAPLITVITPTWERAGSLQRMLDSVAGQSYPRWEHLVISDGPDPEFKALQGRYRHRQRVFASLDSHDYGVRWGVRARLAGIELAQGDLIAWLDDDNAFRPDHLAMLQQAMAEAGAMWGFSTAWFQREDGEGGGYPIGGLPPRYGNLDTSTMMNDRRLHEVATWRDCGQETIDWDLAERWIGQHFQPAFVPVVTVDYYIRR